MRIPIIAVSVSLLVLAAAVHAQAPGTDATARHGTPARLPRRNSTATAFVVTFKVKPGKSTDFESVFRQMEIKVGQNEPGNLSYDLYKTDDPQTYVIVERYKDQAAIAAHRKDAGNLMAELRDLLDGAPSFQALTLVSAK